MIGRSFSDLINDPASWPMGLRDAVQQFGGGRVWAAGLAVLDYPPTWVEGWDKIAAVIERVKKDQS